MAAWNASDIPDLTGRTAIVTGANSGLGLATAIELARHGAAVTMACRDAGRGAAAVREVLSSAGSDATVELAILDLASLASVRTFAESWLGAHPDGLDILVNNAGILGVPRSTTEDGFERQFGTNHLGHFALTGLLLPGFRRDARVVTVSSVVTRIARIDFDDLHGARRYRRGRAYAQSKLANLLFAFELQRRADAAGLPLRSIAAHPGYAVTNIAANGPGAGASVVSSLIRGVTHLAGRLFAQSALTGALPQLYAASALDVPGGSFIAPGGIGQIRGRPKVVAPAKAALDVAAAARLWEISEQLTGVTYLD